MMTLYDSDISGNCYKVRLMLGHLGLDYRTVPVDVDAAGNVYVTETDAERIQVFDANGVFLETFQGPHSVARGPFHPRDIAVSLTA